MPFRLRTQVDPGKHVLDAGAHWRNLANTIEPSICGGDAALRQITLTTCLNYRVTTSWVVSGNNFHGLGWIGLGFKKVTRVQVSALVYQ